MWNDLRYGLRALWKNPGFTAAAATTLAVGIGLNATLFSILNFLLFKPIPVADANRVVWIAGATSGATPVRERFTLPDVQELGRADALAGVLAFADTRMLVKAATSAVRVEGQIVTGGYFDVLGVPAAQGRALTARDDVAGAEMAAVLSDQLARRLFVSAADAVGQPIEINGHAFTIVGVAPRAFRGPDILSPADVWVPMQAAGAVAGIRTANSRDMWWLRAMGRLGTGAGIGEAQAAISAIAASIARTHPHTHEDFAARLVPANGAGPHDRHALTVLAALPAVPLMILLIACANVAGLLLARGVGRARELAIRTALGASRRQIVRQLLAESALLAGLGGAGSLLLLLWTPDLIVRMIGAPVSGDLAPDWRVLFCTIALSGLTVALFGLAPAIRIARIAGPAALRTATGVTAGGSTRLQRALVAGQLSLSLVLLAASGLFLQTLYEEHRADVGFATEGRVTLSFDLKRQRYPDERAAVFYRTLLERASAIPGIRGVSYASYVPLGGRVEFTPAYPADRPVDPNVQPHTTGINAVGPGFFGVLELPILRGRAFDASDFRPAAATAIINETFARTFFPGGNALGQRIRLGDPNGAPHEIVGVARDVIIDEFGEGSRPFVYVPHDGRADDASVIAWTATGGAATLRALEETVHAIDPAVAVFDPMTMQQHLADRMDGERGLSRLLASAAAIALGLAGFGLYGVVAYTVSRRTREIGVRIALGARTDDIRRLFIADGARLALWGLAAGTLPAIGVGVLLSNVLFGIHPADVRALAAAALLLSAGALTASYVPARRAMRVDPMIALRTE